MGLRGFELASFLPGGGKGKRNFLGKWVLSQLHCHNGNSIALGIKILPLCGLQSHRYEMEITVLCRELGLSDRR